MIFMISYLYYDYISVGQVIYQLSCDYVTQTLDDRICFFSSQAQSRLCPKCIRETRV